MYGPIHKMKNLDNTITTFSHHVCCNIDHWQEEYGSKQIFFTKWQVEIFMIVKIENITILCEFAYVLGELRVVFFAWSLINVINHYYIVKYEEKWSNEKFSKWLTSSMNVFKVGLYIKLNVNKKSCYEKI